MDSVIPSQTVSVCQRQSVSVRHSAFGSNLDRFRLTLKLKKKKKLWQKNAFRDILLNLEASAPFKPGVCILFCLIFCQADVKSHQPIWGKNFQQGVLFFRLGYMEGKSF